MSQLITDSKSLTVRWKTGANKTKRCACTRRVVVIERNREGINTANSIKL